MEEVIFKHMSISLVREGTKMTQNIIMYLNYQLTFSSVSNFVGTLQLSDGAYSYTTNRLKHTNCSEKQEYYISLPREPSETIPMHTAVHLGFQQN